MKRFLTSSLFLTLCLLFTAVPAFATYNAATNTVSMNVPFSEPQITPSSYGPDYSHVEMSGTRSLGEVGEPVLPVKGVKVLIPPGAKVRNVLVTLGEKVVLPGRYQVEPGQQEYPLSQLDSSSITPDEPKAEIYQTYAIYPAARYKLNSVQRKMGYSIAVVDLHPVEYNPVKEELSYYKNIVVKVKLEPEMAAMSGESLSRTPRLRTTVDAQEKDKALVQRLIDNKDDLTVYEAVLPSGGVTAMSVQALGPIDPGQQYAYCIITRSDYASAFEPLKQRRTSRGLLATIVTTDWIYANYPGDRPDGGTDDQTKIRNFIIDAYNTWGTRYVLLAGDGDGANVGGESGDNIIPARGLTDITNPEYEDRNIPADLYYACLDGTFDNDADGIYGEKTDGIDGGEIDLVAEVYVGRAPVDSIQKANNFVAKTLAYEDTTNDYLKNNFMLGEHLGFGGVSDFATAAMEEIRLGSSEAGYITSGFLSNPEHALDSETLYDSQSLIWPKAKLISIINEGVHLLNHLGHANNTINMKLTNGDVDNLTNTKYFIGYSQGCYPGAFDNRNLNNVYLSSDSIVEHFTTNSSGAAAFVANSRYGWGMGNTTNGSSQYYARQYWDALFGEDIKELGRMNQDSKEDNIPYLSYDMNRWCYLELNLFGDPALSIHRPDDLVISLESYSPGGPFVATPDVQIDLSVNLKALNQNAANVSAVLRTEDDNILIQNDTAAFGLIPKGQTAVNTNPFKISFREPVTYDYVVPFTLDVSANGYAKSRTFFLEFLDPNPKTRQITTQLGWQCFASISGDRIVWEDYRGSSVAVYMFDLTANMEKQVKPDTKQQFRPVISGDKIAWETFSNSKYGIVVFDLNTDTEQVILSNSSTRTFPRISGDHVVWEDRRNGNSDIYAFDLKTNQEYPICTNAGEQTAPRIDGNRIVWNDYRNGNYDVYLYDLISSSERQITSALKDQADPYISGNLIVWEDTRNNVDLEDGFNNVDIYMYDLETNTERQITTNINKQEDAVISGNHIVWRDYRNNNDDIYMYDLKTNEERPITTNRAIQQFPGISGNRIVWEDHRNDIGNFNEDIYMYDLTDTTPPAAPVVTDAGVYTLAANELTASWSSSEPESEIVEYQYKITRDSASGTVIRDWTSAGANETVTVTGLALEQSKKYFFSVKAKNEVELWSEVGYSDGITVDSTAPIVPVVTDAGVYTIAASGLAASWSSSDPDSGVAEYQYKITRDSASGAVIRDWTSAGGNESVTVTDLALEQSKKYFFSVKAKNEVGLWSEAGYSDGILVDFNSPMVWAVTPASGSGAIGVAVEFTVNYKDLDGWRDLKGAWFLINTKINGANCGYFYYNQNTNKLYLRNNANTSWLGGFAPGSANTIENTYVKLDCSKTTVTGSGSTLAVKWAVTPKSAFAGSELKNLYVFAQDDFSAKTGWMKKGTYRLGSGAAVPLEEPGGGESEPPGEGE